MFVLLFCLWLILNGKITFEICVIGILVSAGVFFFVCRFMDYSIRKELLLYRMIPMSIKYLGILLVEIVKANFNVLSLLLSPKLQPEPAFVYFNPGLKSGFSKVLLANSITLTPGTITVSVENDSFCVHCLDREFAEGIEDSVFVKQLKEMEALKESWM